MVTVIRLTINKKPSYKDGVSTHFSDENHDRKPFKGIGVLVHVQPNSDNKPVFVRLEQPSNINN